MKIIRQKLFAKGVMGQLKKLESISRGLEKAKKEAIEKGINPNSSDLVNKWRVKYVNAQGVLLDKGVPNPEKINIKHTKTVPLKDRNIRLTREERLDKWDPTKQYNHTEINFPFHNKKDIFNKESFKKIEFKRPGTVKKYGKNLQDTIEECALSGKDKVTILDKKEKEAYNSLSPKDKRILRKTIINEAKKAHIKPGNIIKSSLTKDKDMMNFLKSNIKDKNELKKSIESIDNTGGGWASTILPKNNKLDDYYKIITGDKKINKNLIKKVKYDGPKYSFATAHEIGHLKNVKKGLLDEKLINKEHFANNLGRSMKGNLGKTYDRFAKYQEDLYNQNVNFDKLYCKLSAK